MCFLLMSRPHRGHASCLVTISDALAYFSVCRNRKQKTSQADKDSGLIGSFHISIRLNQSNRDSNCTVYMDAKQSALRHMNFNMCSDVTLPEMPEEEEAVCDYVN